MLRGTIGWAWLLIWAAAAPAADAPRFQVTTRKAEDRVQAHQLKDAVVLTLTSPSGIGAATIERLDERWPATVVLKLHLRGLESFTAANGTTRLRAAVSSQDGPPRVRRWLDDQESRPLGPASPFWTEIKLVGPDGQPARALPLQGGYFEVPLPKALFDGNPKSITVQWIDFYRG